ncbi:hypothetical protein [Haladaptatus sp. CMAA 1911]|uniref:hypothetical protein n=1 Tax=Haladaptatus sp. CMAA 1911 TaxID=3368987 RepID=UPI00375513A7
MPVGVPSRKGIRVVDGRWSAVNLELVSSLPERVYYVRPNRWPVRSASNPPGRSRSLVEWIR